ncbi:MAG: PqiC family protein [Pseudomonadota bacterium]
MRRRAFVAASAAAAFSGCASVQPRFYGLGPSLEAGAPPFPLRVGLEPVDVAAVFSRRELVLRPTPTTLTLAPNDLWAEPVDSMLQRVLAEDLARGLGIVQVARLPARLAEVPDRLVEVEILELDGRNGGTARLAAVWRIYEGVPRRLLREGRTEVTETYAPPDAYPPLVEALNRAVARLAMDLVAALRATG